MSNKIIKAELTAPYTEKEKVDFIVEYNHNQGCIIEEVETTYEVEVQVPYTEVETEVVRVPMYDDDGNPILNKNGEQVFINQEEEHEVTKYRTETETRTGHNLIAYVMEPTEEEKQQEERERLDGLFMTRGDVFEAFILAKGLGKAQTRTMIEQAELDEITKALYLNRFDEALNFYRGFPVFDTLGQVVGITSEQLDKFFDSKNYKYLTTCTLTINATPTDATVTGAGTYPYGTEVMYTVEAEGYVTKTDTITLVEDTTLEVVLDEDTTNSTDISDEVESKEE